MCTCWEEESKQRPCFSELVSTLSNTLEGIAGYFTFSSDTIVINNEKPCSQYDHLQEEHLVEKENQKSNETALSTVIYQPETCHQQLVPAKEIPSVTISDFK